METAKQLRYMEIIVKLIYLKKPNKQETEERKQTTTTETKEMRNITSHECVIKVIHRHQLRKRG